MGYLLLPGLLLAVALQMAAAATCLLSDFGGRGDNTTDNTEVFRQAVLLCRASVPSSTHVELVVPPGVWLVS